MRDNGMRCPRCGSNNTYVQMNRNILEFPMERSCLYWIYWITIGWLINLILWITMFWFKLALMILRGMQTRKVVVEEKVLVCNSCGFSKKIL